MSDSRGSDQPDDALEALHAHNARVGARRRRADGRRRIVRIVAWFAVATALALIGFGIALRAGAFDDDSATAPARSLALRTTTGLPPVTTAPATVPVVPTTTAAVTTTGAAVPVVFVVTAARGDSWMEVRSATSTGRVLYSGILRQGTSDRETGRTLWVRFGSVGNVDLSLNGEPVHTASSGTVETLVTPEGLRPS
jgi:hypothetical protein